MLTQAVRRATLDAARGRPTGLCRRGESRHGSLASSPPKQGQQLLRAFKSDFSQASRCLLISLINWPHLLRLLTRTRRPTCITLRPFRLQVAQNLCCREFLRLVLCRKFAPIYAGVSALGSARLAVVACCCSIFCSANASCSACLPRRLQSLRHPCFGTWEVSTFSVIILVSQERACEVKRAALPVLIPMLFAYACSTVLMLSQSSTSTMLERYWVASVANETLLLSAGIHRLIAFLIMEHLKQRCGVQIKSR